jgi:hypothetical protein
MKNFAKLSVALCLMCSAAFAQPRTAGGSGDAPQGGPGHRPGVENYSQNDQEMKREMRKNLKQDRMGNRGDMAKLEKPLREDMKLASPQDGPGGMRPNPKMMEARKERMEDRKEFRQEMRDERKENRGEMRREKMEERRLQ